MRASQWQFASALQDMHSTNKQTNTVWEYPGPSCTQNRKIFTGNYAGLGWKAGGVGEDRKKLATWVIQDDGHSKNPLFCAHINYMSLNIFSPLLMVIP